MLKLHSLHLSGFKSFLDPTSLRFAGQLTAVVGPNGCGKSNLADAVIWVLGERSAKSLRGETMEDVIFAGSEGRKALGMAEVRVELETDPGFAAADDGRLTITRRVHRSGEGEYFVNGRRTRLKDIRSLLMDTGLGLRGYSMIEQGQIGMILSGKPQERRRLLEEAAGITRYKDRRRIAELKLEEARGNLARLDDLLSEVQRAVRSLKRQAAAARRYREKQLERAELMQAVLRGRWARVQGELEQLRRRLEGEVNVDAELSTRLARDEARLAAEREAAEAAAQELSERHRAEARLAAEIEGRQESLKGSRARLEEIGRRLRAGAETAERQTARRRELEALEGELGERRTRLEAERAAAATAVDADSERITVAARSVEEAAERVESLRGALLSSLNGLTELRNRLHGEHLEREKATLRRRQLETEAAIKEGRWAEAEEQLAAAARRAGELETAVEGAAEAVRGARTKILDLEREVESLGEDRLAARTDLTGARQRQQLLGELVAAGRQRLEALAEALADLGVEGAEALSSTLSVPAGWAAAVDLYLGEVAEAFVLAAEEDSAPLAIELAQRGLSGALLRPGLSQDGGAAGPTDSAVLGPLGEALGLPAPLATALPPAWLVATPADAERLARRHPGSAFLTREGIWAEAGVVRVGRAGGPGLLQAGDELAALEGVIGPLADRLTGLDERAAAAERELAEARTALEAALAGQEAHRQEQAVAQARRDDLEAQRHRLAVERETLSTEIEQLGAELARLAAREERLHRELAEAQERHAELEGAFDAASQELERSRGEREATSTSGASRRGRLEVLDERLESAGSERRRLRAETEAIERSLEAWSAEAGELRERRTEVETSLGETERQLAADLATHDGSQQELLGLQEVLEARRATVRELELRLATTRAERDAARERLADLRERRASARQDAEHLTEAFRQELDTAPPAEAGEAPANLAELETDLERCQRTLERLGPVNLLAAEEHSEQEERAQFLEAQRRDVAESVDSLRSTIRQLNQESGERFLTTFRKVNEGFGHTFTDLFRGGHAEMRLMDENDPLDSGIEIAARPPGKRLQSLSLLSGGEKALTAIALLFALFRTKPSPFCILDEVDAPLDDINTLRFVELLRRMAGETQFLVITHNKLTMEAASTLYGVTMQERGVSQLVAVELDEIAEEEGGEVAVEASAAVSA
jgi:chromosome segregation protein